MHYTYRICPDATQQAQLLEWLATCRGGYHYALRELKDWVASRQSLLQTRSAIGEGATGIHVYDRSL
ncbi:helix-turn-helix domain-containing protein [Synechococcus sp. H55.7]|uniref:helix-turn-helix domain-containing protein n=1 Tax=unclassified Synechococcus TaxID=2626047 RepID=UPI0039C30AFF